MVKVELSRNEKIIRRRSIRDKAIGQSIIYLVLIIMYIPVLMLIAYSFQDTKVISDWNWNVFNGNLYAELFQDTEIMVALGNTVIIAIVSAIISVILGTCGAIGVFYSKKRTRALVETMTQIPVVNAEIVIAMSLTVMFVFIGSMILGGQVIFSFWTLLAGHVVLSLPFVYLSVKPKLLQMDPALFEAALDLGCTPNKALFKVTIPQIMPGILSGFLLSVTLSLDDFIVTAFTRGAGLLSGERTIDTLSTLVQAKIKKGPVPPAMRALTTFIFLLVLAIVIGITVYNNVVAKKKRSQHGIKLGRRLR